MAWFHMRLRNLSTASPLMSKSSSSCNGRSLTSTVLRRFFMRSPSAAPGLPSRSCLAALVRGLGCGLLLSLSSTFFFFCSAKTIPSLSEYPFCPSESSESSEWYCAALLILSNRVHNKNYGDENTWTESFA
jgi:hypothetical protein